MHILYKQYVQAHIMLKSMCVCVNIYFHTPLLVDLKTVHPTYHALYMCSVNVHVSLYILCCPN